MPIFDLQTVAFWASKNAKSIADIEPTQKSDLESSPSVIGYTYKSISGAMSNN